MKMNTKGNNMFGEAGTTERPSQGPSSPSGSNDPLSGDRLLGTRTSASERRLCLDCGKPITGRRRNGFCSDRCRQRANRAAKQDRLEAALARIEGRVERFGAEMQSEIDSLRAELLGGDGREERDQRDT